MTDADRLALRRGDTVLVRDDHGDVAEWVVRHRPTQLYGGQWVIWLEGMAGCYDLGRVTAVVGGTER